MPFAITDGELQSLSRITSSIVPNRPLGITSYRSLVHAYENIYKSQANVRTVVDYLARQFGSLTPRLLEHVSDDETRHASSHGLDQLMRHPHPRWSRARFTRAIGGDLLIFDNWIAVKTRIPGARAPVALTRIPPQFIEPEGGDWLTADIYRLMGTSKTFPRDDVVHIAGYNPEDPRWGLSPIESLRRVLSEDLAAGEARENYWDRATQMGNGWISRPAEAPDWGKPGQNNAPSGRDRFLDTWKDLYTAGGPEAGGTPILEEGMLFHPETFDAAAAQYLEARKLTGIECSRAWHCHPSLLGFEPTSGDAQDAVRRSLLADTLAPFDDYVAQELTLQLLPDFENDRAALDRYFLDFDLESKLRGDFLAEAEATSRSVGAPWMTRNEARRRRGMPNVPGGDDLITPLNVTAGGRANPTDTAPGTPGLGQASRRGLRALPAPARKALEDLPATYQPWATQHANVVAGHAERQSRWFHRRIGSGYDASSAFNKPRADSELGDDLGGLALEFAPVAAAGVASRFGIDFDLDVAEAWLINNARISAENFNAVTLAALTAPEADTDVDTADAATAVFDDAGEARADQFGIDRVGTIDGFSAHEAAQQGGATMKTWETNSANPRPSHAAMDGETVAIGDDFSIGAPYPHAPELDVEDSAGCTCTVSYS